METGKLAHQCSEAGQFKKISSKVPTHNRCAENPLACKKEIHEYHEQYGGNSQNRHEFAVILFVVGFGVALDVFEFAHLTIFLIEIKEPALCSL